MAFCCFYYYVIVLQLTTIIISFATPSVASTHWIVTEDGKIQEQVYSIFNMKRPYDLVALMQQEMRAEMAENFMDQLDGQINDIDHKRNKAINLQDKFYTTEMDCLLAEKPLTDYNLFVSTIATCPEVDNSLKELCKNLQPVKNIQEPNCVKMSKLDYSIHAFEHLQAMKDRKNLSILPDMGIVGVLPNVNDIPAFGHAINKALKQNTSSWILYNFAGYYFRLVGDGFKAIECNRRALHFSPLERRHIALLNLGNVLHLAQRSDAAALVVQAAIDIDPTNPVLHFTLGNIYAILAEYNKSVEAFNAVLQTNPEFEAAVQRKHAVLCHSKLEKALEAQINSLKKTMNDLGNFEKRLEFWQKQQFKLLEEQAPLDVRFSSEMDYTEWKILQNIQSETHSSETVQKSCSKLQKNGQPQQGCNQPIITNVKIHLDSSFNYLIKQAEIKTALLKEEILAKQNERLSILNKYLVQIENTKPVEVVTSTPMPTSLPDLPSVDCTHENTGEMLVSMPIFFHKKDIGLGQILGQITDDMPDDKLPVCHADYSNIFDNLWNSVFKNIKLDDNLITVARKSVQRCILDCCGAISVEEFGNKVAIAIDQDLAPKWLLYHVAAMYWGALGDVKHLSECLVHSKVISPPEYKHVTVVPIVSFLGSTGLHLAAIHFLKFAIDINDYEPGTIMLLADLYVMATEYEKALEQYRRILAQDPENQNVLKRVTALSCYLEHVKTKQSDDKLQKEIQMSVTDDFDTPIWIKLEKTKSDDNFYGNYDENSRQEECDMTEKPSTTNTVTSHESHIITDSDLKSMPDKSAQEISLPVTSDGQNRIIRMKLTVNQKTEQTTSASSDEKEYASFGNIQDDPLPDVLLQVLETPHITTSFSCKHLPLTNFKHFTSTWLSVSVKGIIVSEHFDAKSPMSEHHVMQPVCDAQSVSSALTLDHLAGIKHRSRHSYAAETGLREAFQTLGRESEGPDTVEAMGTRLALALQQNSTSWVLSSLAALYWRVTGHAEQAIDCLRVALHYAPRKMQDIPLISLANIFHRASLYNDAIIAANMAMEISPAFVVIHFTLANIFAAKGNLEQAKSFYETTLTLQPSFEPALDRLRAIHCSAVFDKDND